MREIIFLSEADSKCDDKENKIKKLRKSAVSAMVAKKGDPRAFNDVMTKGRKELGIPLDEATEGASSLTEARGQTKRDAEDMAKDPSIVKTLPADRVKRLNAHLHGRAKEASEGAARKYDEAENGDVREGETPEKYQKRVDKALDKMLNTEDPGDYDKNAPISVKKLYYRSKQFYGKKK